MSFDLAAVVKQHGKKPSEQGVPQFIVLYGRPGGGKTWLAASISEVAGVDKVLIIDTEGSTKGTLTGFDDSKIDILPVTNLAAFESIFDALVDGEHPYDAVIIDTLDVAQDWAIEHYLSVSKDGFAAWGEVKKWTNKIGNQLQTAEFKTVVCFHESEDKSPDGTVRKGLQLSGAAKAAWPGMPQMVAWLERKLITETTTDKDGNVTETDVPVTYAHFDSDDGKVTKNRYNLPPIVQNPDFKSLFAHIEKTQKSKTTTKAKENK